MTALCKHLLRHYSIWRNHPKRQRCFTLTVFTSPSLKEVRVTAQKGWFYKTVIHAQEKHNKRVTSQSLRVTINSWNTRISTFRSSQCHGLWITKTAAFSGKLKGAAPPVQAHYQPKVSVNFATSHSHINSPIDAAKPRVKAKIYLFFTIRLPWPNQVSAVHSKTPNESAPTINSFMPKQMIRTEDGDRGTTECDPSFATDYPTG